MNQQKHTHENNDLMDTLEHQAVEIDMTDKREQRRIRRKALAVFLGLTTLGAAVFGASATRPEAAPQEAPAPVEFDIGEASWLDIAQYDDYGEGGIQVFIDTVSQMRPDLIAYSVDDEGEVVYDGSKTRSNIEDEFGVNVTYEGQKLQQVAGGDNVQHGAKVMVEYDGREFNYSPYDN